VLRKNLKLITHFVFSSGLKRLKINLSRLKLRHKPGVMSHNLCLFPLVVNSLSISMKSKSGILNRQHLCENLISVLAKGVGSLLHKLLCRSEFKIHCYMSSFDKELPCLA
jgi:hypothetical protein